MADRTIKRALPAAPIILPSTQENAGKALNDRHIDIGTTFTRTSSLIPSPTTDKSLTVTALLSKNKNIVHADDGYTYRLSSSKDGPVGELLGLPGGMQSGASSSSSNDPYRHLRRQAGLARGLDAAQILTRLKKDGLDGFLQQIGQTLPPQVGITDLIQIKQKNSLDGKGFGFGDKVAEKAKEVLRPLPHQTVRDGGVYDNHLFLQELPESIAALRYEKKHRAAIFFAKPSDQEVSLEEWANRIYKQLETNRAMSVIIPAREKWSGKHVTPIHIYSHTYHGNHQDNEQHVFINLNDSNGSIGGTPRYIINNLSDILVQKNFKVHVNEMRMGRQVDHGGCHTDALQVSKEFLSDQSLSKWVSEKGAYNAHQSIFPPAMLKTAQLPSFINHHSSSGFPGYPKRDKITGQINWKSLKSLESHAAKHSAPTKYVERAYLHAAAAPNTADKNRFVSDYIGENPRAVASSIEGVTKETKKKDINLFLPLKTLEYVSAAAVHLTEASKVLSTHDFQGYIEHLRNTRNL